jgi:hypothetical protein
MLSIVFFFVFTAIPFAIVSLNATAFSRNGRRGLNLKCAAAALLYGLGILFGWSLGSLMDRANDYIRFWIVAGSAALSAASCFFALWGMYEIRCRPGRWSRGWKRAMWSFWLGNLNLFSVWFYFYLSTHPDLFDRVLRAVEG